MTTTTITLKKGEKYYVDFVGDIYPAKVLKLISQQGKHLVRFRIGLPLFGTVITETAERFYARMVKA